MSKLVGRLRAIGFRKGVLGTSRGWFALWAGISAARFLRARLGRHEEVVERVVLGPGQVLEVRDTSVDWGTFDSRANRKARTRTARAQAQQQR